MKRIVTLYIALFLVYLLQGTIFMEGSIISRSLLIVILLVSLYFWGYALLRFDLPIPLKILSVLLAGWTIYGIMPILFGMETMSYMPPPFTALKGQYLSLLPIFSFYVFFRKGWLTEQMMLRWVFIFFIVVIISFYNERNDALRRLYERGGGHEEIVNNAGYTVVSFLTLLPLLWKKAFWQYLMLGICMLYVLMGYKRGAILSGTLCAIWFFYYSYKNSKRNSGRSSRRSFTLFILTIALFVGAVYATRYFLSTSDFFNERLEQALEGDTSNRSYIYGYLWNHFVNESGIIAFIFGNGAYGTLELINSYAHNDWLEIAIDNGVIFLLLYLAYWISLFRMLFKSNKDSISSVMLGMFIIIYFLKTLFSMSYNDLTIYASCALGYSLANYEPTRRNHYS